MRTIFIAILFCLTSLVYGQKTENAGEISVGQIKKEVTKINNDLEKLNKVNFEETITSQKDVLILIKTECHFSILKDDNKKIKRVEVITTGFINNVNFTTTEILFFKENVLIKYIVKEQIAERKEREVVLYLKNAKTPIIFIDNKKIKNKDADVKTLIESIAGTIKYITNSLSK